MPKHKYIESPEKLLELFKEYVKHEAKQAYNRKLSELNITNKYS
jgi:hypothetical protein